MTARKTPDLDALVLDALRVANLGATVRVTVPQFPADSLPLVVARQVPGGTASRLGTVTGIVDLQVMASTRRDASDLARRAYAALSQACLARFAGADGHLNWFADVSGAPAEIRTGEPTPDPELFRFQTTCRITARANL